MTKQTINKICDQLSKLADNFAENERTIRSLVETIRLAKYDVTKEELEKKPKEEHYYEIERLLRELLEDRQEARKTMPSTPFITNPGPSDWPPMPPITCETPQVNLYANKTQGVSSVYAGVADTDLRKLRVTL